MKKVDDFYYLGEAGLDSMDHKCSYSPEGEFIFFITRMPPV